MKKINNRWAASEIHVSINIMSNRTRNINYTNSPTIRKGHLSMPYISIWLTRKGCLELETFPDENRFPFERQCAYTTIKSSFPSPVHTLRVRSTGKFRIFRKRNGRKRMRGGWTRGNFEFPSPAVQYRKPSEENGEKSSGAAVSHVDKKPCTRNWVILFNA